MAQVELNAEQIKKALECYSEKPLISECEKGCVYYEKYNGFSTCCLPIEEVIIKNALALINSQEQKIEKLTEVVKQSETAGGCEESIDNGFSPSVTEPQRENETLRSQKYWIYPDGRIEMIPTVESVRADTVREMHSKIKERCIKGGIYPAFVATTIDKIAKEMLDEK